MNYSPTVFSPSLLHRYEHLTPSQYKAMQLSGQIPMNAPIIASALLNQSSINPLVKNGQPVPAGNPGAPSAAAAAGGAGAEVIKSLMQLCYFCSEFFLFLVSFNLTHPNSGVIAIA